MTRARAVLGLKWILGILLSACSPSPDASPPPFARADAFPERDGATHDSDAFDVATTDMDRDGDPDLPISCHSKQPLEGKHMPPRRQRATLFAPFVVCSCDDVGSNPCRI